MKIACLGWGSLIWRPENLLIQNKWFEDGPFLPIEFTRQSSDGRMTLIIDSKASPVRVLWTLMTTKSLDVAITSLKEREGIGSNDSIHHVHSTDKDLNEIQSSVYHWLKTVNIDAAIWTGLSFNKKIHRDRPNIISVLKYLKGLDYRTRKLAEEYIRKAPKQIDTEYRRAIEIELGWSPNE